LNHIHPLKTTTAKTDSSEPSL